MLGSLVAGKNAFDEIASFLDPHKKTFVVFGGLSYGGAIAQAAVLYFQNYLQILPDASACS
jgi:pimeloyl-ACP methyl ester carboxylesterase